MATQEISDNWVWRHILKLDNFTLQIVVIKLIRLIQMLVEYIYNDDERIFIPQSPYGPIKIWTEKDRLKWENDNDLAIF